MPDLDGLSALPLLLEKKRDLVVIMASTLTRRNAEVSLKALSLGAADYIPKPATNREVTTSATFRRELIEKIRQLGLRRKRDAANALARGPHAGAPAARAEDRACRPARSRRSRTRTSRCAVLADAAARAADRRLDRRTAGADERWWPLGPVIDRAPVLITQHMPPTFTTILAEHLARERRPAREPSTASRSSSPAGSISRPAAATCAVRQARHAVIALDDGPLVNFCKPAVDPLFLGREVWGRGVLAVILTGMGSDGMRGGKDDRRRRRQRDRAGRSDQRGVGHAGRSRECRASARRCCRSIRSRRSRAAVCGRQVVTPLDYEYLRKLLKERSGLDAVGRQAISGRKPAAAAGAQGRARRHLPNSCRSSRAAQCRADRRRGRGDDHQRDVLLPRQDPVRSFPRDHHAGADAGARARAAHPHLVRGRLDRAGALFARDVPEGDEGASSSGWRVEILGTDLSQEVLEKAKAGIYSQFEVQRGLPIQMLVKYFTQVGETWQIAPRSAPWCSTGSSICCRTSPISARFDVVFCRNVLIYFYSRSANRRSSTP
jgi:two-component system chemotaxis response regulator CheB